MKRLVLIALALLLILPVLAQSTGVTAEAIQQANLRALPDVTANQVGEIFAGTAYPVVGRSEFFPWVLLGDPATLQPIGWVFRDLVNIIGDVNQVPFSSLDINGLPPASLPAATLPPANVPTATLPPNVTPIVGAQGGNPDTAIFATPSLTPSLIAGVSGRINAEVNVRYGPGVEYNIIGRAFAGDVFEITAYHTQVPWVQVRFLDSPNGSAWIAQDLLEITGNLFALPAVTQLNLNLPTLTPTPSVLQSSGLPGSQPVSVSPEFAALGERIWNQILDAGFVPGSRRFGALYIQNLQTGEAITFGNNVAFSGTSINKIPILVEYFAKIVDHPSLQDGVDIANTMICSENVATNQLLSIIGDGDALLGSERTTGFMRELGLTRTFLTAPFDTTTAFATATPIARPVEVPTTNADQVSANPNPTNQMTVEEMGWLLSSVYQCAVEESGPLMSQFSDQFTPQECRKMLHVMSNNTVDALLKAGVPADVRVAHKHGWIEDTHGNAAVFFTPGGDYVMVMMLHEPTFLQYTVSLPVIANASREVYNYFNPDQPLEVIRDGYIPTTDECGYTAVDPLANELESPFFEQALESSVFAASAANSVEVTAEAP